MVGWPIQWRNDKSTAERVCEHGLGHPDPDDVGYHRRQGRDVTVHGCDGCCAASAPVALDWSEGDEVSVLTRGMSGRWLVTTQGSQHVWDLDAMTYQRIPGRGSAQMAHDHQTHPIVRVEVRPIVGGYFRVWFTDPDDPGWEQFRQSSTIRRIERLEQAGE